MTDQPQHIKTATPQDLYPAPALSKAATLSHQAERWARYVLSRTASSEADTWRRALEAVRFSAEAGARSLVVPAELRSTFHHQDALRRVHKIQPQAGFRLTVEDGALSPTGEENTPPGARLSVRHEGHVLGFVPADDEAWLRPLLLQGACVHLLGIRLSARPVKRTCRVAFAWMNSALSRLDAPASRRR